MNFEFGSAVALGLLLLIPCFFLCREYREHYYFSKLSWAGKQSPLLSIDTWMRIVIYTLMVFALAKPFLYDATTNQSKRGRDLILAIDASGSMAQTGYSAKEDFKNKYDINIEIAKAFIQQRNDDNMGAVVFGTFAYTASPLTYDLAGLSSLLDMTEVGVAGESTAIGDAIIQAIDTLSFGDARKKAIILLTDGFHNAGKTSPKKAVAKALEQKIRIYTIGIGKAGDYDAALLKTIAKESGGRHYNASTADALKKAYTDIDALEPSPIRSENYLNKRMLAGYPTTLAFILLLFWTIRNRRQTV
jgi:Ca-activated chloride channel family protein